MQGEVHLTEATQQGWMQRWWSWRRASCPPPKQSFQLLRRIVKCPPTWRDVTGLMCATGEVRTSGATMRHLAAGTTLATCG